MQYFGGKAKIAKYIVPYLERVRKENQPYLEPFIGGANIISKISGERYGCDFNEYLIEMYNGVKNGYELPDELSKEQYIYLKYNNDTDKILTGFVGFGCSYSAKWFGGYALTDKGHVTCKGSKNSLLKKMETMQDVKFEWKDYKTLKPRGMLIYCDPPYISNTQSTKQSYGVLNFDNVEFWNIMRKWSMNNDVYISEYEAPNDFKCVLEIETQTSSRNGKYVYKRNEKLFTFDN